MPAPLPPVEHRIKKGEVRNPGGRPKKPEHLRLISNLTKDELNATVAKYIRMDVEQIKEFLKKTDIPIHDAIIAKGLLQSFTTGDLYNYNLLMDRVFGRPAPVNVLVASQNTAPQVIVTLPSNGTEATIIDAESTDA